MLNRAVILTASLLPLALSAPAGAAIGPLPTTESAAIRLRVLVESIKPGEVFSVSGPRIFMGSDDTQSASNVTCEYNSGILGGLLWKNPMMMESGRWYCKSAAQAAKVETSLYLHSQNNVMTINGDGYRGHIELMATKDSLYVINHIPLDAYLASLANSEMSSSFPAEALRAQIIAARSYALATALERRKKLWPFDLYNTQADQVYKGVRYETEKSWKLAQDSSRQVLNFNNSVLKAYYHSSSGGHLEIPHNVWGDERIRESGAYRAKPNPYDRNLTGGEWQITLSKDLGNQIKSTGTIRDIKIMKRTEGLRVKQLLITGDKGQSTLSGVQFRNLFGAGWIKSALFGIKKQGSSFVVVGKGWGHGVGMSQWGAKVMADSGKSAEQILKFYYPNANVAVYGRSTPVSSSRADATASAR